MLSCSAFPNMTQRFLHFAVICSLLIILFCRVVYSGSIQYLLEHGSQNFFYEAFLFNSPNNYSEAQMQQIIYGGGYMRDNAFEILPLSLEPPVPFSKVDYDMFISNGDYDLIFLTQSPGFTPATSDELILLITSYIDII